MITIIQGSANVGVNFGTTLYTYMWMGGILTQSSEANANYAIRQAGTMQKMSIFAAGNTINGATSFNFRKNTANGNATVSIPSSTSGQFTDNTNTDSVSSGDLLAYQAVSAGTSGLLTLQGLHIMFFSTSTVMICGWKGAALTPAASSSTVAIPWDGGNASVIANESLEKTKVWSSGTWRNLQCTLSANARTTTSTLGTRKNAANGNQTISIAATTTGRFEDAVNTDSFAVGDFLNYVLTVGTDANSITLVGVVSHLDSPVNTFTIGSGYSSGKVVPTACFFPLGGDLNMIYATEAPASPATGSDYLALANLSTFCYSNTTTTLTLRLRKNSANANASISIGSSVTGLFTDSVSRDTFNAGDTSDISTVTTGSSSIALTWTSMSMTYNQPKNEILNQAVKRAGYY